MSTATAVLRQPSSPSNLRRVGAVLAGLFATFAVTTAVDAVLHATGIYAPMGVPPMSDALFGLALGYRVVICTGGAYLTARLAPDRPLRHALVLGLIGLGLSVAGAVAFWDAGPHWYPLTVAASALPCAFLGGQLGSK